MPDFIGRIAVPEIALSGVFPIVPDYPWGRALAPEVYVHTFLSGNAKIEQRFHAGNGARRFTIRKAALRETDRQTLLAFWEDHQGQYGAFTYNCPNDNNVGTTPYTCRFLDPTLSFEAVSPHAWATSVNLEEIPSATPSYALNAAFTRFPTAALQSALLEQAQTVFPVIRIRVSEQDVPDIALSDRRVIVGGQLYQVRLLNWDGISQGLGGESDQATFTFGNADSVMTRLVNDTDLFRAEIAFSLFHVETGIRLDLWKGEIISWSMEGDEFRVRCADGLYELNLPYPTRLVSRTCWKQYNDGKGCPWADRSNQVFQSRNLPNGKSTKPYVFQPDAAACDKSFDGANGCLAHGMADFFGGIYAVPQAVRVKDNSTGTWGYGRSTLTSVSLVADSVYSEVVPEVYTDADMPVNAKVLEGRDEGDFYDALGLVCEGPIGAFGTPNTVNEELVAHRLDGQLWHGYPGTYGLRLSGGRDPNPDPFCLGEGGSGIQYYNSRRAAGAAFVEFRRSDTKGLQLSRLAEHQMQVIVNRGMSGWKWAGPGEREEAVLTNPVWIALNMLLRAKGLRYADAVTCERFFDVDAAIAAAGICDLQVKRLVPDDDTLETQYKFLGALQEQKPLRDWIQEVLNTCLGYFTFSFGKLRFGIRENSGATEVFGIGNIIFDTLHVESLQPAFNHLVVNFGDKDFGWLNNAVVLYDIDHAIRAGSNVAPLFVKSQFNLVGCATKSQAARIVTTRLREELGGVTPEEQRDARAVAFRTTALALNVEPGTIAAFDETVSQMPAAGERNFRVTSWKLNQDFSIEIAGRSTTDSMYSLVAGPKPADVEPSPLPEENQFAPGNWSFVATTKGDGQLHLSRFTCRNNPASIHMGLFDVYYADEIENKYGLVAGGCDAEMTTLDYVGQPPTEGEWVMVDAEIMRVTSVTPDEDPHYGIFTVERGQVGTTAAPHLRVSTQFVALYADFDCAYTLEPDLALLPGANLVVDDGGGPPYDQAPISSYDSDTGKLRTTLPLPTANVGDPCYCDPRLWRLKRARVVINFQPRLFLSPARESFAWETEVPYAAVAVIEGRLENTRGKQSTPVRAYPLGPGVMQVKTDPYTPVFPFRMRLLGTEAYQFPYDGVPSDDTPDGFRALRLQHGQSFQQAYMELFAGEGGPLSSPPAPQSVLRSALGSSGSVMVSGNSGDAVFLEVRVSGANEMQVPVFVGADHGITADSTLTEIGEALAAWLNADEHFRAFYSAFADPGTPGKVCLVDERGIGGVIEVDAAGGPAIAAGGFAGPLGVQWGRRYACAYADTGHGYLTEPSPLGVSSGPTGDATRVEIRDVPYSADPRVNEVRIYAAPDGQEGPLYRIAVVANGTNVAVDTAAEAELADRPVYPGPTQPAGTGKVIVTVKKDGSPWFKLYCAAGQMRSEPVHGFAMDAIEADMEITADIENQAGAIDLQVFLQ